MGRPWLAQTLRNLHISSQQPQFFRPYSCESKADSLKVLDSCWQPGSVERVSMLPEGVQRSFGTKARSHATIIIITSLQPIQG